MNYKEAKNTALVRKLAGLSIALPAILSSVISLLKMIYFRISDGSQLGEMIARPFRMLVSFVYENTRFLNFFWENSPTPDIKHLLVIENYMFLTIYVAIFVGFAFYASGSKLSARLREINEKIENQMIQESIKGERARTREEIESSTNIPTPNIFTQFHTLYLAPVITGIIVAVILKLLGV